ncbi:MAG: glycine--tRNA ligase subunit alpha, partial [Planctomycetes bacterium]|nr:glycine--tRNA ligase subunit alpha [Planctomycetota bacterium]
DAQAIYLKSLKNLGINLKQHDIRFVEDDWESPTLGATGLGWEVWIDGMEITQFTYFQKVGTIDLEKVCLELTYGLERIAMFIQKKETVFDLEWTKGISYGAILHENEVQFSKYNFEEADGQTNFQLFDLHEKEARNLLDRNLVLPAYDHILKCSHAFNILDARQLIGPAQRTTYIGRVRNLAKKCALGYLKQRDEMGFPLMRK